MPDQAGEFHKWIGYCISAWAKLEEDLFDLCWRSLATGKQQAAIVYFRTPGLDTRLKLVDELVRSRLPKRARTNGGHDDPDVIAWRELVNAITEELSTRRRIAHQPVRHNKNIIELKANPNFPRTNMLTLSWLEIYTSENEEMRSKGSASPLNQVVLTDHYNSIQELSMRLAQFGSGIFQRHVGLSAPQNP